MEHDAVVIGAGHNGLAAAVHLSSLGWNVAVVEAAAEAGGAVKTREITLPGFRHDLYAMNVGMFAGSRFFAAHKARLIEAGIAFAPASDCFATAFPEGDWLGISQDLDATTARIAGFSARDAARWRALATAFPADASPIFGLLGAPMPSRAAARVVWKAWRAKGAAWVADMARLILSSPRDFLDENFESPQLKAVLAVWGLHLDFPPDAAGGALFPYLEGLADQSFGMALGRGGAATIIDAMVGALRKAGGTLHLGARVDKVQVSLGRATGVVLEDGRGLRARRAVIANVHPKLLGEILLREHAGSARFRRRIGGFRAGPGTMMIHLALSDLPRWSAGAALRRFAYVHLAPEMDMMARAYAEAMAGLLPAEPVIVVGQPTAIDPSRAPEGKHILWVQVRVLPSVILGDAVGAIQGRHWDEVKELYATRVMAIIESYAPGLGGQVLARTVLSPMDLERDNVNLIGGDSLSGSHHLGQNFIFRPAFGFSRYRTAVDRLYMVGASTWPGAGTGAGSGFLVGKMLERRGWR